MGWQEVPANDGTQRHYWYDDSAADPGASTTWERPTVPAADGSYLDGGMNKQAPVPVAYAQPQQQPAPVAYAQQPPPQSYGQPVQQAYGQPQQAYGQPQQVYAGQPGMVVVGQPQPALQHMTVTRYRMGGAAWCMVCLLILLFWPLCWIPCVCEQCQEPYQETIMVATNQPVVVHHVR
eukprot:TRINITY_DN12123_c0_g1_i1.p1 TRINITY_DN12123_c0_g1~~TRINITY_DN12123_c0_g1_i1.p1  ORF type:complete len:178 (-),score=28.14 TRINITY_DN12123_c0_g1_i1:128-661(-)